jgi:hypothetical protein
MSDLKRVYESDSLFDGGEIQEDPKTPTKLKEPDSNAKFLSTAKDSSAKKA